MPDTTCHMSISLDGFVAGPDQSRENPLGKRGREVHSWHLGDERANDADATAEGWLMRPRGAYVMGRNMFGPIRGEWDEDWNGWWGSEPPYHAPVFVLTHHAREPVEMEGGTSFHFVTQGFEAAYAQARETARGWHRHRGRRLDRPSGARRRSDRRTHARRGPRPFRVRRAAVRRSRVTRARAGRGAPLSARHAHPLPAGGVSEEIAALDEWCYLVRLLIRTASWRVRLGWGRKVAVCQLFEALTAKCFHRDPFARPVQTTAAVRSRWGLATSMGLLEADRALRLR
jgi:dihydrofolate reductase